ncbi:oxygenase MpaB family protein, partial [Kibdelosporangium lantanae]
AWADRAKLRLAADFNRRKDTYLFMLYGLGSGIMSTVIPREARSVYWSAGGANMQDRAAKTFTFGYDLSELNAFDPTGQFLVTANKTRLVHAAVRHLLPQSPHWRSGSDEQVPISNGDILVTFHSLGTFVRRKLREWHVPMTAAEEDAFLHMWQVAMHMLGVRDEFIPKTWAAADFGVSEKQLRKDLELLWMCGLPGYGPGDLIDLSFVSLSIALAIINAVIVMVIQNSRVLYA